MADKNAGAFIVACYVIRFGDAIISNDDMFAVIERSEDIITFPAFCLRRYLREEELNGLIAERKVFRGETWMPPRAWRRKVFGIFALPSIAEGKFNKAHLNLAKHDWRLNTIRDISELKDVFW